MATLTYAGTGCNGHATMNQSRERRMSGAVNSKHIDLVKRYGREGKFGGLGEGRNPEAMS